MTLTQIRIDNNLLTHTGSGDILTIGDSTSKTYVYGVIDHNTFHCDVSCYGLEWVNLTAGGFDASVPAPPLGTINNLFFEDNVFTIDTLTNNGTGCIDHWGGSAIVYRHNTSTNCRVISHGVLHGGGPSNFEIYQNSITMNANTGPDELGCYRCIHHQGSNTFMVFNNTLTSFAAHDGDPISLLHYRSWTDGARCDGSNGGGYPDGNRAPTGTNHGYPCFRQPGRDVTGAYKPIYVWNNKWSDNNAKADVAYDVGTGSQDFSSSQMISNREYFNAVSANAQTTSSSPFTGTTGMGFGTLANRPTTCTTSSEAGAGVGYFATDQGTQGILYTCSATNTWSVYYTPFSYPHPLVGGAAGFPVATLSPLSFNFGTQNVGTSSGAQPFSLQNTGTSIMSISSIAITGPVGSLDFSQTNTCGATLAVSASCTINVVFTPGGPVARTGSVTVTSDATNSPTNATVTGTGIIAFSSMNGITIDGAVTVH